MMRFTKNEMAIVLTLLKSPDREFNARNISRFLEISHMGALKILKRLEGDGILRRRQIGKAIIFSIQLDSTYACDYITFLLKKEAEESSTYIKRWVNEIRKIKEPQIAILFGSVLTQEEKARDIDVLFVVREKYFSSLRAKISKINELNDKNIHPLYQTTKDLKKNILKRDNVILNAIKGIVAFGEKDLVLLIRQK